MTRVVLLLALSCSACCGAPGAATPNTVAVRETVYRSDSYPLPLSSDSRAALMAFLMAGANRDGIDDGQVITVVNPDAEQRWGKLLDALARPENLDKDDLDNGTYSAWFHSPPVRQVVDARAERPNLACPPAAVAEERLTWVFVCGPGGKWGELFVQQALAERAEVP